MAHPHATRDYHDTKNPFRYCKEPGIEGDLWRSNSQLLHSPVTWDYWVDASCLRPNCRGEYVAGVAVAYQTGPGWRDWRVHNRAQDNARKGSAVYELAAIGWALGLCLEHLGINIDTPKPDPPVLTRRVRIWSDCQHAMDTICSGLRPERWEDELDKTRANVIVLNNYGIQVELHWCPGHTCEERWIGNHIADQFAARATGRDLQPTATGSWYIGELGHWVLTEP